MAYLGFRKLSYPLTVQFRYGGSFPLHDFYDTVTFWLVFFHPGAA